MGKKPKKVWGSGVFSSTGGKISGLTLLLLSLILPFALGGTSNTSQTVSAVTLDDQVTVPLPSRTIAKGEKLKDIPLTYVTWPRSRLPENIVLSTETYGDAVVKQSVEKLSPIPLSAINVSGRGNNPVAEGIPSGMRAITVRVDLESSIEGWVRSGTRVDVILINNDSQGRNDLNASVIADNVKVLSAGRSTKPETTSPFSQTPATVTLLVTQEQALKIKTASSVGKLTFTMRGLQDNLPTSILSVSENELGSSSKASSSSPRKNLQGTATGPDGNVWVLTEDSFWIKTPRPSNDTLVSNNRR